ncbi:MAG: hypothetical protein KGO96_14100 [Elusimicrobia bacterium]|nr:hypothetical protein [Elusimicrobiota bacterium]MDE2427027.1 hypothetical protein [Elusimicrobiota bacterium]
MAKLGCVAMLAGIVLMLLAAASRLWHCCAMMGLGPKSYAAAAALFLLLSISAHTCACVCGAKCGNSAKS